MVDPRMDALDWLRKQLDTECPDLARAMLERIAGELMGAEADALCGAGYEERSPERVNQRTATAPGAGIPAPARSSSRSPSCAPASTSRTG